MFDAGGIHAEAGRLSGLEMHDTASLLPGFLLHLRGSYGPRLHQGRDWIDECQLKSRQDFGRFDGRRVGCTTYHMPVPLFNSVPDPTNPLTRRSATWSVHDAVLVAQHQEQTTSSVTVMGNKCALRTLAVGKSWPATSQPRCSRSSVEATGH